MPRTLTILDTRGLMLRAYHGSNDNGGKTKSDGTPMYSWEGGLRRFVEDVVEVVLAGRASAHDVISCWDGGNTYRLSLYPNYKKGRAEKAEGDPAVVAEIRVLEAACKRLLNYLGIHTVYVPGEEADDLIALLVQRLDYDHCTVITNDKDLLQLIKPGVSVVTGGVRYDQTS